MNQRSKMKEIKSPKTPRKGSHNHEITHAASLRPTEVAHAASLRSLEAVRVALGFRVKSGRAIAVVLAGPAGSPHVSRATRDPTLRPGCA